MGGWAEALWSIGLLLPKSVMLYLCEFRFATFLYFVAIVCLFDWFGPKAIRDCPAWCTAARLPVTIMERNYVKYTNVTIL